MMEMEFDEEHLLRLPSTVIRRILTSLRQPEIDSFTKAFPFYQSVCDLELKTMETQFERRKYFKWNRCLHSTSIEGNSEELVADRVAGAIAYHPPDKAIYLFGGEPLLADPGIWPETRRRGAVFNDIWKFDLTTLKWSRVIVPSPPYPEARCNASLISWNDELVLYGGSQYGYDGAVPIFNDVFVYNPKANTWREMRTENPGPKRCGHSVVISGDYMILYGGNRVPTYDNQPLSTSDLFLLNLVTEKWFNVKLHQNRTFYGSIDDYDKLSNPREQYFPNLHQAKSKLVKIRDGLLLIVGEMMRDEYGSALVISYAYPEFARFKWKRVENIGRWWNMKKNSRRMEIDNTCPNRNFWQTAVIQNENTIRLVSLGKLRSSLITKNELTLRYDLVKKRCIKFIDAMRSQLERGLQERIAAIEDFEREFDRDLSIECEGIACKLTNVFADQQQIRSVVGTKLKVPTMNGFRMDVASEEGIQWEGAELDDIDIYELKQLIREMVQQLHNRFYPTNVDNPCSYLSVANRALRRMAVYTAEIKTDVTFEQFPKIEWVAQPIQYRAAPDTEMYSLTGAHHEVVMHGGRVYCNEVFSHMGYTYLLTGTSNITQPRPRIWEYGKKMRSLDQIRMTKLVSFGTSALGICSIPDELRAEFKKFRFSKSTCMNALILKISREQHELSIEERMEDCNLAEVRDELPSQQPRFVLLSWCKKHDDNRSSYPLSLIYFCPTGSSPELQMMYAGSRNFIVNEFQLTKNLEIRDIDELDEDLLDSKF
ncbi:unnamed protein product [Caenorhabditis bovis]|uniref:ADF-H domain-containing protein n=1 Tax=Caenorhabditis bovis TaxID=2654633 RepID=A0A8S1EW58_9PELO|nr:unnamed protein product [Caenorhabditis bovis]